MQNDLKETRQEPHDSWLEDALNSLRARFMVGGWAIGGAAGAIRWLNGPGDSPLYERTLVALGLTLLAGTVGGFAGAFARNALTLLLSRDDAGGERAEDAVSGVALGSFCGAFLGLVVMLPFGTWESLDAGVAWGAGIGAFLGALPGNLSRVLLRMMAVDSRAKREAKRQRKEAKRQ